MARFDRTIPPGSEGTITLEVKTKGFQGSTQKRARVFTNDPKTPELTIGIKGKVWAPIHLNPKYIRLTGTSGDKIGTVVNFKGQKEEPLTLELASVSIPDKVDVELRETEKGRIWELRVDNKVNHKTTYSGKVKLATNYPEKPELWIRIAGNIRPSVEDGCKTPSSGHMSEDGLQLDIPQGVNFMDDFSAVIRKLAVDAIDVAINKGGNAQKISQAQEALAEGDALRASGAVEKALRKYTDARIQAKGSLP